MKKVLIKTTIWLLAIMLVVTLVPQMGGYAFGVEDNGTATEEESTSPSDNNNAPINDIEPSEGENSEEPQENASPKVTIKSEPEVSAQSETYNGGLEFSFNGIIWAVSGDIWNNQLDSIENTHYSKATGGGENQNHFDDVYSGKKLESAVELLINTYTDDDIEYDRGIFADYNVEITTNTNSKFNFTIGDLFKTRYYFASESATGVKVDPILVLDSGEINLKVGQDAYTVNNGMYCVNDVKSIAITKPGEDAGGEVAADYSQADTNWYTDNKDALEYELSTKAEIIGLAKIVNVGENNDGNVFSFKGRTIKLAKNILFYNNCYPIGRVDAPFEGTFNGNGKSIKGINQKNNISYMGLFGYNLGTIEKLAVSGTITNTSTKAGEQDFIGAVCGFNAGTISEVRNDATVDAGTSYNVGGIAGFNTSGKWTDNRTDTNISKTISGATGTITSCENKGNVTGCHKVGGIVGENAGEISACVNSAKVDGTNASTKNGVGGIAGRNGNNNDAYETGIIESCYNTGEVGRDQQKWIGGLTGFQNSLSSVKNCYSVGTLPSRPEGTCNPIVGQNEGNTDKNFSLLGLTSTAVGAGLNGLALEAEQGIVKSDAELKSPAMIISLGGAYQAKSDNYPILTWQTSFIYSGISGDEVIALIDELPAANDVTVSDKDAIEYARVEYDSLSQVEKDNVTNYSKLTSDEASLQDALEELLKIENATINLTTDSYVYTGGEIVPKFTVTGAGGELLKGDTDYTVSCSDNVNVGTNAMLTINGKGKYSGSKSTNFTIFRCNISSKTMTLSGTLYSWTGKAINPGVTVSGCNSGTDYSVSYSAGRANIGKYTVTVYGIGNYEGSKTLGFTIGPKGASIKTPKAYKGALTVKWSKQSAKMPKNRITGYQAQVAKNRSFTVGVKTSTVKGYKKTSKKITRLSKKKTYYTRVRTYMKTSRGTVYSNWSTVKVKKTK